MSAPIAIKFSNNEVISSSKSGGLKPNLLKSKKAKMTKSKNLINFSKYYNIVINIGDTRFLTFKAKVIFKRLRQTFIKIPIF